MIPCQAGRSYDKGRTGHDSALCTTYRSVYVAKLQPDGEPACGHAMNRIRPSRVHLCHSLGTHRHTRRKTLQSALQVLQVRHTVSPSASIPTPRTHEIEDPTRRETHAAHDAARI
jgi:hypothetical protein